MQKHLRIYVRKCNICSCILGNCQIELTYDFLFKELGLGDL